MSEPATSPRVTQGSQSLIAPGEAMALSARGLSKETCEMWGYTVSAFGNSPVQVANYKVGGVVVAQKVRWPNKDFRIMGDGSNMGLYGQHLWRDGGRRVVITEGEIDALSVSQAQGNKWPVVSIPKGAQGAKKELSKYIQWLLTFEEVVLFFDNDEPGITAAQECAMLFPPGRCKIAKLNGIYKDANDALKANAVSAIIEAVYGAKAFRPDGVVTLSDVRSRALEDPSIGYPWFLDQLTALTYGRREAECYGLGAGTGVGKSDFLAEQIQFDIIQLQQPVAAFMLEQGPAETVKRVAGKLAGKTFHIPDGTWTKEQLIDAIDQLEAGPKLYLYDSFGATDWSVISSLIRFLAHSEGVKLFYLDHLTALAAAESDERTGLERIMAEMAALAKELNIIIHFISHLSTPEGKPHEEGGRVMIRHFKGSRAIGFWSHFMFGLERDQQHDNESLRKVTTLRVLKDRYTGRGTGETIFMGYDGVMGKLRELDYDPFEQAKQQENSAEGHGFPTEQHSNVGAF